MACDVRRWRSCSRTPRKIVKGIPKRTMDRLRIIRGQDSSTPVLQRRRGRAAEAGRGFERPAEVLARMAKADAQAVMTANLIIECTDEPQLLGKRRRALGDTTCEPPVDLTRQPGLTLRASADHDRIGA